MQTNNGHKYPLYGYMRMYIYFENREAKTILSFK